MARNVGGQSPDVNHDGLMRAMYSVPGFKGITRDGRAWVFNVSWDSARAVVDVLSTVSGITVNEKSRYALVLDTADGPASHTVVLDVPEEHAAICASLAAEEFDRQLRAGHTPKWDALHGVPTADHGLLAFDKRISAYDGEMPPSEFIATTLVDVAEDLLASGPFGEDPVGTPVATSLANLLADNHDAYMADWMMYPVARYAGMLAKHPSLLRTAQLLTEVEYAEHPPRVRIEHRVRVSAHQGQVRIHRGAHH